MKKTAWEIKLLRGHGKVASWLTESSFDAFSHRWMQLKYGGPVLGQCDTYRQTVTHVGIYSGRVCHSCNLAPDVNDDVMFWFVDEHRILLGIRTRSFAPPVHADWRRDLPHIP